MRLLAPFFCIGLLTASAQSNTSFKEHIVKTKETVYNIAVVQHGISVEQLRQANPEIGAKYSISVGQKLKIPVRTFQEPPSIPAKNIEVNSVPASLEEEKPVAVFNKPAVQPPPKKQKETYIEYEKHIVRSGENVFDVAVRKYRIPINDLLDANPSLKQNPQLYEGQELVVPILMEYTDEEVAMQEQSKPEPKAEEPRVIENVEVASVPPAVVLPEPRTVEEVKNIEAAPQIEVASDVSNNISASPEAAPIEKAPVTYNTETVAVPASTIPATAIDNSASQVTAPANIPAVDNTANTSKPKVETTDAKYRRSSLFTLMIDGGNLPKAETIKTYFLNDPIPDKFNDHNLDDRIINSYVPAKDADKSVATILAEKNVARQLVARWFNRDANGCFNMDLVSQRGFYNASDLDVKTAVKTKRGMALLADAGEELLNNTFVLVSRYKYVSKEEIAQHTKTGLSILGSLVSAVAKTDITAATNAASAAATIAGKGYVVQITSYLYQLNWNEDIASRFYNEFWNTKETRDEGRKQAFDNCNLFSLKFVGSDNAMADVQSSIFGSKSEEELVELATKRSINKVILKLQRNHEVFRTKTPLYSVEPITAKIGAKEGLKGGDKFDVLEAVQDKDGRTVYKKKGVVTVDKMQIWNNEYALTASLPTEGIDRTYFIGSNKGLYPGMLLKQK